jgi:hypothetical protein
MPPPKTSRGLRRAMKRRSRRWRRREVVFFYLLMFLSLLVSLGEDHHSFVAFSRAVTPVVIAIGLALSRWPRSQQRMVTSLDDRAQVAHGVNFEQLTPEEQKEVMGEYRMGPHPVDWVPDERQEQCRLQAYDLAFRFLRVALPCLAAAYWAVYLWMPDGNWRVTSMDSPVVISWAAVFVISLPKVIEMWTEPDQFGESREVPVTWPAD